MTWYSHTIKKNINIYTFGEICSDIELEEFFIYYRNHLQIITNLTTTIFNMTNIKDITFVQMIKTVVFLNSMKSLHKKKLITFVLVFNNDFISNIVDTTFYFFPPVVPYLITTQLHTAFEYANNINKT